MKGSLKIVMDEVTRIKLCLEIYLRGLIIKGVKYVQVSYLRYLELIHRKVIGLEEYSFYLVFLTQKQKAQLKGDIYHNTSY